MSKQCRWCQREISDWATVCPYPDCARTIESEASTAGQLPTPPPAPANPASNPPGSSPDRSPPGSPTLPIGGLSGITAPPPPPGKSTPGETPVRPAPPPPGSVPSSVPPAAPISPSPPEPQPPQPPQPPPPRTIAPLIDDSTDSTESAEAGVLDAVDPEIQRQLDGLRREIRAGRRKSWLLGNGAVVAVLVGVGCFALFHLMSVMRFAELGSEIEIQRDAADPQRLLLAYSPVSTGRIGFRRADEDRQTELLERVVDASVGNSQTFEWRARGLKEGDLVTVSFRRGLSLVTEQLKVPSATVVLRLGEGSASGQVVNALNNEPLSGVEVRVVGTGISTLTDDEGNYRIIGAPTGDQFLEFAKEHFTADKVERTLFDDREIFVRRALSPGMEAGQIRIVLTWDDEPVDLDAHLEGPLPDGEQFHIDYHDKGDLKSRQFVRLDVDDRNGHGPETITVLGVLPGTYRYWVHDYANRDRPEAKALADSNAEVAVYQGGQTYRYRVDKDISGNVWNVCSIRVKPDEAIVAKTDTYEATESAALGLYDKRTLVGAERTNWITRYGGNATSETSVREGLEWLARHQADDGHWSMRCVGGKHPESKCEENGPCTDEGGLYEMGHTGLAVLAFQAAGHYPFNNQEHSERVGRGLDWMVSHQRADGGLIGSKPRGGYKMFHKNFMYEHGIAAFALTEACAIARASGDSDTSDRYRSAAEKAIAFLLAIQHNDGGWRYSHERNEPSDTSVSGWQVLALKSAKEAEIDVPPLAVANVRKFFDSRAMGQDGRTGYNGPLPQTEATTGIGMFTRQFLLDEPDAPLVSAAARFLADYAESEWAHQRIDSKNKDFYTWYACTLAMFQVGGKPWERWNRVVRDTVINLQRHDACERGSWDPNTQWGQEGGRIYSTALAVLTLEVYYRYASRDTALGVEPVDAQQSADENRVLVELEEGGLADEPIDSVKEDTLESPKKAKPRRSHALRKKTEK